LLKELNCYKMTHVDIQLVRIYIFVTLLFLHNIDLSYMNHLKQCAVCGGERFHTFLKGKNYRMDGERFDIVECDSCSFRFTNPIPTEEKIGAYYDPGNYVSHSETKKGLVNFLFHQVRKITLSAKYKLISKHAKGKHLLDIGCGSGRFIEFVKQKGWSVKGLEPDEETRAFCLKNGLDVSPASELGDQSENAYDIITMWHVLEHVYHLNKDIESISKTLKQDGTLFVAVPNCASYDAQKYGEHWAAYDLPIHLHHFRKENVEQLFQKHGMKVVDTLPMKFDSYYISLISEQYKSGKDSLGIGMMIKGFWTGLVSNLKAKKGTYSSQIYVIKHQ